MQPEADIATDNTPNIMDNVFSFVGNFLPTFVLSIFVVFGLIFVSKIIWSIVKRKIISNTDQNEEWYKHTEQIAELVSQIVFYCLSIFAFFVGFKIIWFDVGLILWWVSFGIWLAFKEVLWNMIAGIFLLTMKEVKIWDTVDIDGKYFGKIEQISIRTTTIRLVDMRQVVLPNIQIIESAIQTYSSEEMIRLDTTVEIDYETNLDFALEVIKTAINNCPFIKDTKKTKAIIQNFGWSGIDIKCFFYIDPNCGRTIPQITGYMNHIIANYLKSNNIIIPYPHTVIKLPEGKNIF